VDGGGSALPGQEGSRSAAIGNKAARRGQAAMQSDCELVIVQTFSNMDYDTDT